MLRHAAAIKIASAPAGILMGARESVTARHTATATSCACVTGVVVSRTASRLRGIGLPPGRYSKRELDELRSDSSSSESIGCFRTLDKSLLVEKVSRFLGNRCAKSKRVSNCRWRFCNAAPAGANLDWLRLAGNGGGVFRTVFARTESDLGSQTTPQTL